MPVPVSIPAPERGDDTKRRLIDAALRVFARDGYDGVSIRRIAEAAEANVAAIAYHFGGKRGLYLAAARYVAERNGAALPPLTAWATAEIAAAGGDRARLGALLAQVIAGLMRGMVTAREDGRAGFLVRELLMPSDAFDILHAGFFAPLNRLLAAIAAEALGMVADAPEAVMRGHLLLGTMMPLIAGREVVERRLGYPILDGAALDRTIAVAAAAACASLGLPVVPAEEPPPLPR